MKKILSRIVKMADSRNTTLILIAIPTIFLLLASSSAIADAYKGKEDIRPDGKKTTVYNHTRPGALYPFPTFNYEWDGVVRPCCWNGYGVDPSGLNYWAYYNQKTECYPGYDKVFEGTDHCKPEKGEPNKPENIPEPGRPLILGFGLLFLAWRRKCSRTNKD